MISTTLDDDRVGAPVRRPMTPVPAQERAGQAGDPGGEPGLAPLAAALEAAPDPRTALRQIAALRERLDEVEREHVTGALAAGASLAAVGRDLGISRQAVHRRYGASSTAASSHRTRRRETAAVSAAGVRLTAEARLVLRHALAEAEAAGDAAVDGGHVLLALLRPPALPALEDAGVALGGRAATCSRPQPGPGSSPARGSDPTCARTCARRRSRRWSARSIASRPSSCSRAPSPTPTPPRHGR